MVCAKMVSMSSKVQVAQRASTAAVMDAERAWQQIVRRDAAAEFLYGVTTTGVFCRPGCGSRLPLRRNVRFFESAAAAQAAGFRACRRCNPLLEPTDALTKVRAHLERNAERKVSLDELGRVAGLSPFTVQRMFKQAMGVSPLQYQRALRASGLRKALKRGASVTDAIYAAGFGSASRAHEGAALGMTPARFAAGGRGEQIGYAAERTAFGWMVVGATARGLCWLALAATKDEAEAIVRAEFPAAELRRDAGLGKWVEAAVRAVTEAGAAKDALPLDLRGTAFQLRVWQALRAIPRGETRSYSELAREMGVPRSTRAVARACATNRVAVVVPCHRVVGAGGALTGYRWGVERKRKLLDAERRKATVSAVVAG